MVSDVCSQFEDGRGGEDHMNRARDLRLGLAGFAEARESARERVSEEGEAEREFFLGTILRNEVCAQSMLLNLL